MRTVGSYKRLLCFCGLPESFLHQRSVFQGFNFLLRGKILGKEGTRHHAGKRLAWLVLHQKAQEGHRVSERCWGGSTGLCLISRRSLRHRSLHESHPKPSDAPLWYRHGPHPYL